MLNAVCDETRARYFFTISFFCDSEAPMVAVHWLMMAVLKYATIEESLYSLFHDSR